MFVIGDFIIVNSLQLGSFQIFINKNYKIRALPIPKNMGLYSEGDTHIVMKYKNVLRYVPINDLDDYAVVENTNPSGNISGMIK